jgi:bifunctional DNA-binding transcriptional regulator/antitoxin component of YhaV-PrlF toxin-antitoxin module
MTLKPIAMSRTGRLTLPASARKELGLTDVAHFDVELTEEGILLRPVTAIPPEDAWAYTPKVLASIQRGLEDIAAGRTIRMSPAELDAYGDAAEAAREAEAAKKAKNAKPQAS